MSEIPAADLANQLPRILQAIASGEEFLVTEAGRPVARILPPVPAESGQVLSGEEWQRKFAAWMKRVESRADRYPPGFAVDDSYDAIYGERENAQR
jgi:antitoxin (DNA-binding transcriptional repressor) of toxin-antitoxin stability system